MPVPSIELVRVQSELFFRAAAPVWCLADELKPGSLDRLNLMRIADSARFDALDELVNDEWFLLTTATRDRIDKPAQVLCSARYLLKAAQANRANFDERADLLRHLAEGFGLAHRISALDHVISELSGAGRDPFESFLAFSNEPADSSLTTLLAQACAAIVEHGRTPAEATSLGARPKISDQMINGAVLWCTRAVANVGLYVLTAKSDEFDGAAMKRFHILSRVLQDGHDETRPEFDLVFKAMREADFGEPPAPRLQANGLT